MNFRYVSPQALLLALGGVVSVLLLVVRWQLLPPGGFALDLGDPATQASHFYPVENSGEVAFRWSRDLSAVSLPALATNQTVSFRADPARPSGAPPPHVRLFVGDKLLQDFELQPGWQTYTFTVGPGLGPDIRLLLESDTFFPSASDRRRLGVAVSRIETAPQAGRLGFVIPPALWLLIGAVSWLPAALALWGRSRAVQALVAYALALLPVVLCLLLPGGASLPSVTWIFGLLILAALVYFSFRFLGPDNRLVARVTAVGRRGELLLVAILSAIFAVGMTWPVAARMADSLPGWPGDNFAFLYKFWWFRTALFEQHRNPFQDPNTFAPFGFNLGQGEPTLANTLPGALLGVVFNDTAAYNLVALLSFLVSAIGAYLLVRELTGSPAAALIGGLAFAFAPYRLSQYAGHIQLLGTGWIALAFYFAEKALRTRRWQDGALGGLSLALAALSAWYYALMVGLMLVVYIGVRLWQSRRELAPGPLISTGLAGAVAFAVVTIPLALPSLALWGRGGLSHSAKAADEFSAAPADFLIPNEVHPVWGQPFMSAHADQNVIESSLYIGIGLLATIAVGWWAGRNRASDPKPRGPRTGLAWILMLVVSFVLSLGLTLHDTSGQVRLPGPGDGSPIPLPGQILFDWLPLYSSMRAYARFGIVTMLAAVVLMGIAWGSVAARWPRFAVPLTFLACLLVMGDFWTGPYAWGTSRVVPSKTAQYLAAAPPGTIIELPLTSALSGPSLYSEVYYGKPIAYGYDTFEPPEWSAARPALVQFPSDQALDLLKSWGVRYVVVSGNAYGADWPGTLDYLRSLPRLKYLAGFDEQRTWDVDPQVIDARPDMEEYLQPGTTAIFEVVK